LKKKLHLNKLQPKNESQSKVIKDWNNEKNLILLGFAGTGKTWLAMSLALKSYFNNEVDGIIIFRSALPVRDIGHLPGDVDEKMSVYMEPYKDIVQELVQNGNSKPVWPELEANKIIDFRATSFTRGLTFDNKIVIIDEANNLNFHELDTIIGRLGVNSRLIIAGDETQSDHIKSKDKQGLSKFVNILKSMPKKFAITFFEAEDIVRSDIVKDYIMAKHKLYGDDFSD